VSVEKHPSAWFFKRTKPSRRGADIQLRHAGLVYYVGKPQIITHLRKAGVAIFESLGRER
jgi:hypothetical protein